jgi:hypothetical protein
MGGDKKKKKQEKKRTENLVVRIFVAHRSEEMESSASANHTHRQIEQKALTRRRVSDFNPEKEKSKSRE